jgi:F0F1-type ATP synthase epsilon subunit
MILHFISPDDRQTYDHVRSISLPTASGIITILPEHIALTTQVVAGDIERAVEEELSALESFADTTKHLSTSGGIAMIENNVITIISSS